MTMPIELSILKDPSTRRPLQEAPIWNDGVVQSSKGLGWHSLQLDRRVIAPIEWPEFVFEGYTLTVFLNTRPIPTWRVQGGHWRDERPVPGSAFVLTAGQPLQTAWKETLHQAVLSIDPLLLLRQAQDGNAKGVRAGAAELVQRGWQQDGRIQYLVRALMEEAEFGGTNGALFVDSLASALSAHLLTHYAVHPAKLRDYQRGLGQSDLSRVVAYIGDCLADDLSLEALAASVSLSPYHFARLFKQSTGQSPHQYVVAQRVERAKSLLLAGHLKVGEVAQAVGFYDHAHFIRHFKRLTGLTPGALRSR